MGEWVSGCVGELVSDFHTNKAVQYLSRWAACTGCC